MISLNVLVGCLVVACGTPDAGSSSVVPSDAATTTTNVASTTVPAPSTTSNSPASSPTGSESPASPTALVPPTSQVTASPSSKPSATARPVFIVRWQSTGGSCADQNTILPRLVIYADGRVVRTEPNSLGQYCEPIPTFHTGQVDLAAVRIRVERYLTTEPSKVDMSHSQGVADAGLTSLEYTAVDGSRRLITADAIDVGLDQMTVEQRGGRNALAATIAGVDKLTPTTTRWTPSTLNITRPAKWVPRYSSTQAPAWPVPVTTAVQQLSAGADGSCTTVTGPAAEKLYVVARARTSAAATWTINKESTFVAIGVVLEGFSPCR